MTDGQSLLLLFVVLYLLECLRWLPPRSQLLLGQGRRWLARGPFQPIELAGGSPALLAVLPPLQVHVPTLPWLLTPAAAGLEIRADRLRPLLLPWEKLTPRTEGRTLHLASGHRVRYLSEEHARQAQQQVQHWITLPQEAREEDFLRHAQAMLKEAPLTEHAQVLTAQTRGIRLMSSLIFLWAFGVLVALYRWLGDGVEMLWAVGILFVLQFTQAFIFFRRARGIPYRFWKALAVSLLPQHAMRAADHFCDLKLPAASHPLAARSLLGETAWKKLAGQTWKQTRHLPAATADLQCRALETFFQEQGLPVADLEPVPSQEPGSALYCPGCQAQFQAGASRCQDCGGIELRAF